MGRTRPVQLAYRGKGKENYTVIKIMAVVGKVHGNVEKERLDK